MTKVKSVGLFGGTFDPVHIGHLRTAVELRESLGLDEMRMIPCGDPYHKDKPEGDLDHRLEMLKLAIAEGDMLTLDDRELLRPGPSYTYDTLIEIRQELGNDIPLILCMGMDSLADLANWHQWHALPALAHIVAVCRPGFKKPATGPVSELIQQREIKSTGRLRQSPCGSLLIKQMTLLPISASQIRETVRKGLSIRYLVPDSVADYIDHHHLYTG